MYLVLNDNKYTHSIISLALICLLVLLLSTSIMAAKRQGQISGKVINATTGEPLPGATVEVTNIFKNIMSDSEGDFVIPGLATGTYSLSISNIGYETIVREQIDVADSQVTEIVIRLIPRVIPLKSITVTPGRFNIMGTQPAAKQSLSQKEITTIPQLADDFFRAVSRLPGVSANDFSPRITVRGSNFEDLLVTMDGLQIYEPFHMKDIDGGAISIIDVASVEEIDLMTGGFPANYGNKHSGVFNINSRRVPPDHSRLSLGINLLNTRFLYEGTFANNRGSWLVSARRGYIDLVLKLAGADDEIKPTYYDLFAKTQYQIGKNHVLSTKFLHAGDDMYFRGEDDDIGDTLETNYGNTYGWLTLLSTLHPKLTINTIASTGQVNHDRTGQVYDGWFRTLGVKVWDKKDFRFVGLKSDVEYEIADNYVLKLGLDVRRLWSEYDYLNRNYKYQYFSTPDSNYAILDRIDSTLAAFDKDGDKVGIYISNRVRIAPSLTAEVGVRYDYTSYTDDKNFSPRINMVHNLSDKTVLRAGWGRFYQSEGIDEIAVGDGETDFYPAEKADHWVIGLEHRLLPDLNLRLEGYYKKYRDLRPQMRNSFDDIEAFPEVENDRTIVAREKSISKGLEIFLKNDKAGKFSWWASYAYAKVEENIKYIFFPDFFSEEDVYAYQGYVLPSPNDQRHTLYFDFSFRPNYYWQFNVAFQLHSGWPYTDCYLATGNDGENDFVYVQAAEQWSARHKPFSRLDLRVNRYIRIGNGRMVLFFELINALGRKNVRAYDYIIRASRDGFYLKKDPEHWFGRVPSFGINYEVNF